MSRFLRSAKRPTFNFKGLVVSGLTQKEITDFFIGVNVAMERREKYLARFPNREIPPRQLTRVELRKKKRAESNRRYKARLKERRLLEAPSQAA